MKTSKLIDIMQARGVKLPEFGTGQNGRITNYDLEQALALDTMRKIDVTWGLKMRMALGSVMLAYRYDELPESQQELVFTDLNDWVMEEKYNGLRMTVFVGPYGAWAFGRNRSVVDFLPVEYTDNILVPAYNAFMPLHHVTSDDWYMLDCELVCDGYITLPDGNVATGLPAAVSIVSQSDPYKAHEMQKAVNLRLIAFDYVAVKENVLQLQEPYYIRRKRLEKVVGSEPFFYMGNVYTKDKRRIYEQYLDEGKEGVVFKHGKKPYVPSLNGKRNREVCIKCKRSMAGARGADIDAWVGSYFDTPEWVKQGLIGGINLYCYLDYGTERKVHHIASVASMPLEVRKALTNSQGKLNTEYLNKVVVVDGQDISNRNTLLRHARVDWKIGFRQDKNPEDCVLNASFIESQMF